MVFVYRFHKLYIIGLLLTFSSAASQEKNLKLDALKDHPFAAQTDIFAPDFSQLKFYKETETLCCAAITTTDKNMLDAEGMHYVIKTKVVPTHLQNTPPEKTIVLACVHGTWSNHGSYAVKLEHEVLSFASLIATAHNCTVDILYYQWSGSSHRESRKMAGILLSTVLLQEYPDATIWTVAHSHGCSVVHHACAMLNKKNKNIDTAIHLCAPDLDIPAEDLPIKRIFNFYGTRDMVQIAGSATNKFSLKRTIKPNPEKEHLIYNIRVQHDGINTDHFNIKLPLLKNLPWIISMIDTFYPTYGYFDANIFDDTKRPMIVIKDHQWRNKVHVPISTSLAFSKEQADEFLTRYKRPIHHEHDGTIKAALAEWSAKLVSDIRHKSKVVWQEWWNKKS